MNEFEVGDRVLCSSPGSWVDGKYGTVLAVSVTSSDGIHGYGIRVDGDNGHTVLEPAEVSAVEDLTARRTWAGNLVEEAAGLVRKAAIVLTGTGWSGDLGNTASDLHDKAQWVRTSD